MANSARTVNRSTAGRRGASSDGAHLGIVRALVFRILSIPDGVRRCERDVHRAASIEASTAVRLQSLVGPGWLHTVGVVAVDARPRALRGVRWGGGESGGGEGGGRGGGGLIRRCQRCRCPSCHSIRHLLSPLPGSLIFAVRPGLCACDRVEPDATPRAVLGRLRMRSPGSPRVSMRAFVSKRRFMAHARSRPPCRRPGLPRTCS